MLAGDDEDYIPFEDGLMEQDDGPPEPIWLGENEIDIDICLGCGRYYGCTQPLIDLWRRTHNPQPKDVMPQLCYKCMEANR